MAASLQQFEIAGFFLRRWRGETPLGVLFWRDMLAVATLISLSSTLAALGLLALQMPVWLVLTAQFCPLPYNAFLFACVWRQSAQAAGWAARLMPPAAALWFVIVTVI